MATNYKIPICQYCGSKNVEEYDKNYLMRFVDFYCFHCETHFSISYEELCDNCDNFVNINKFDVMILDEKTH